MEHFEYRTKYTCSRQISFDLDGNIVRNVKFLGGCDGNLKAVSKLVEGMSADRIQELLAGNTCGMRPTSCADQLAKAVKAACEAQKSEN